MQASIEDSLKEFPVVGLIGPRQAGKTTLARMILERMGTGPLYLDLELSSDVNKLRDPELYLRTHEDRLVIIDEVQRMPELFPLIRAMVDQKRTAGRFLILGSASPALVRQASKRLRDASCIESCCLCRSTKSDTATPTGSGFAAAIH